MGGVDGARAEISYGTTLALAQEIDAGAPVDVFISGDPDWMDYLDGRGVIHSATIVKLLRTASCWWRPLAPPA